MTTDEADLVARKAAAFDWIEAIDPCFVSQCNGEWWALRGIEVPCSGSLLAGIEELYPYSQQIQGAE